MGTNDRVQSIPRCKYRHLLHITWSLSRIPRMSSQAERSVLLWTRPLSQFYLTDRAVERAQQSVCNKCKKKKCRLRTCSYAGQYHADTCPHGFVVWAGIGWWCMQFYSLALAQYFIRLKLWKCEAPTHGMRLVNRVIGYCSTQPCIKRAYVGKVWAWILAEISTWRSLWVF